MPQLDQSKSRASQADLLLLPDGRILVHNLTPALAEVLSTLDPENEILRARWIAPKALESEVCDVKTLNNR